MPHHPLSARGAKPLNLVQLDAGLLEPQPQSARVYERAPEKRKGNKEAPLSARSPPQHVAIQVGARDEHHAPPRLMVDRTKSKESSSSVPTTASSRGDCNRTVKQFRAQENRAEVAERAQAWRLEKNFNMHFSSKTNKRISSKEKTDASPLPLLAKKVIQAANQEEHAGPIGSLLGPSARSPRQPAFERGDEVEVRDKDMSEWKRGVVTTVEPLMVKLHDWNEAFSWQSVRPAPQEKSLCACGFIFVDGGLFCSACGSKRVLGASATVKMPSSRPPLPPRAPSNHAPQGEGESLKRRRSATPQRRNVDSAGAQSDDDTPKSTKSSPRSGASSPRIPSIEHQIGRTSSQSPRVKAKKSQAQWEQNTAQIMGENGDVISVRPPLDRLQWEQDTVPLLAEDGEVVRVRPPGRNRWEENTVPIRGQNGEVIALRPCGDRYEYEMHAWKQSGAATLDRPHSSVDATSTLKASFTVQSAQSSQHTSRFSSFRGRCLGTSMLPIPSDIGSAAPSAYGNSSVGRVAYGHSSGVAQSQFGSDAASIRPLGTSMLPIPSDLGSAASSLRCRNTQSAASSSSAPATGVSSLALGLLGTSMMPIPSDIGSAVSSLHAASEDGVRPEAVASSDSVGQRLEITLPPEGLSYYANQHSEPQSGSGADSGSSPTVEIPEAKWSGKWTVNTLSPSPSVSVGGGKMSQSSSTDSMRTIDEMIRVANLARCDTPKGLTFECLADALKAETVAGRLNLASLLADGHTSDDELATRLRQLPELWRNTIFQMLEQAESIQKKVEVMEEDEHSRLARMASSEH